MKYAVIATGNKQYKVLEGDVIDIDQLSVHSDDSYRFPHVLLFVDGDKRKFGLPYLSDIKVTAQIVGNQKGKKIRVAKFKAKSRYRRIRGFRASLTRVKIEKIALV